VFAAIRRLSRFRTGLFVTARELLTLGFAQLTREPHICLSEQNEEPLLFCARGARPVRREQPNSLDPIFRIAQGDNGELTA
jgi:hypothetical protein